MKRILLLLALCGSAIGQAAHLAASGGVPIYIAPASGFEVNIAAALEKKHIAVQLVTNESQAEYVLRATEIETHRESGAGKIARCMFAYCVGIEDGGDVSVQLIRRDSDRIVWAYQVTKQKGAWTRQSMAEAIAKHLHREFVNPAW